ncbi:MAG TPA: class I SAM-dependent methyltransferase [Candidatus Binataceae bacterium]
MTLASDLSVAEYFARLASSYGAGEYYRKRRAAAVAEIGRRLGKIESLLDLGCGNGTYLAGFREAIDPKFLVGADLSFRMAQEALRRGVTNVIIAGDATLLPFRPASFRAIFCSHVLQFVADLPRCVAEIAHCLAPGGTFVIAGGEFGVRERLKILLGDLRWSALRAELPRPRDVRIRRNLADYRDAAQGAGLSVDSQTVEFTVTWADLAEFYRVRWLSLYEPSSQVALAGVLDELVSERGNESFQMNESLLFCQQAGGTMTPR